MKKLGLFIAAVCAVCIGFKKAAEIKKEMAFTDNLLDFIKHIRNNIEFFGIPLEDIYNKYTPPNDAFKRFVDTVRKNGWIDAVDGAENCFLSKNLKKLAKDYGDGLGSTSKTEQLNHNDYYINELTRIKDDFQKAGKDKIKVYICLGFYAGILLVILFI